jgi:pimeloyl-ACP methyl ester carboxylesterase
LSKPERQTQSANPAAAIAGTWHGTVEFDVPVPIVLHVEQRDDALSIVADYPLLRSAGIPVREVSFAAGMLRFATRSLGDYAGTLSADGSTVAGIFAKDHKRYPLVLRRGERERTPPPRPQTPKPPFGYSIEHVRVAQQAAACELAGTLTIPESGTLRAAILLITGSGAMDRDETVFGHKPFWVLADHLSRHGYAVLRLDDRGVGESSGDRSAILPQDEADDMAVALDWLHVRSDLRGVPIGLVAHSMGGVIGMTLAARRSDVDFLVTMGSPGGTIGETFAERECAAMRDAGAGADAIESHREFTQALYRELAERPIDEPIDVAQIAELAARFGAGRQGPTHSEEWIARFNQPWFRGACSLDPAAILARVAVPMLAINGGLDVQTLAKPNLAAIGRVLGAAGHVDIETIELPGLNHLFQTCKTGAVYEYPSIEETFAPLALETIRRWLDARFSRR